MRFGIVLAALATTFLLAGSAQAQTYYYELTGDSNIFTPAGNQNNPAGTWEGPMSRMAITDNGDGTATLDHFVIDFDFSRQYDASGTTGVPNCFAEITTTTDLIAPVPANGSIAGGGALGTGDVTFGGLSGWTRNGYIYCYERTYSGTDLFGQPIEPVLEEGTCGGCVSAAGLNHDSFGPGPPPSAVINSDGWSFSGDLSTMSINGTFEYFNILSGQVYGQIDNITGSSIPGLPGLMPLGAGILGLGLSYLGARKLRKA